jgi:hypothetical protein
VVLLEFTIEPFVAGRPGRHVTEAIAAAEALAGEVQVGPFGTSCRAAGDVAPDVARAVVAAALANGATHVNLHVERETP